MQLLQWMISFTGGGGARLMPAIMGLTGVRSPRLGWKRCRHRESGGAERGTQVSAQAFS